jgi:hypothetical protein
MANDKYQSARISDDDILDFWWIRRYFYDKSYAGFFVVPLIILYIIFVAMRLRAICQ